MVDYQIDIQSFNGSWTSDIASTAWEAYVLIAGITDAAQIEVNNVSVSTLDALNAWYETETAQPADVDQGGDFEGFLEAVNAEPEPPFVQTGDNGPWYTLPVITADGHKVQSVITKSTVGGFLVTCGAIGTKVDSFRAAIEAGDDLARAEVERVNCIHADEMDRNPWDYDEDETRVENHDRTAAINRKHARIEEIRRSLARLDRERDSLQFELSQLIGE